MKKSFWLVVTAVVGLLSFVYAYYTDYNTIVSKSPTVIVLYVFAQIVFAICIFICMVLIAVLLQEYDSKRIPRIKEREARQGIPAWPFLMRNLFWLFIEALWFFGSVAKYYWYSNYHIRQLRGDSTYPKKGMGAQPIPLLFSVFGGGAILIAIFVIAYTISTS